MRECPGDGIRRVSIVHAALATFELNLSFDLGNRPCLDPPVFNDCLEDVCECVFHCLAHFRYLPFVLCAYNSTLNAQLQGEFYCNFVAELRGLVGGYGTNKIVGLLVQLARAVAQLQRLAKARGDLR